MTETDKIIGYEIDFFPERKIIELYQRGNKKEINEDMLPLDIRCQLRSHEEITNCHQKNVKSLTIKLREEDDN